MTTTPLLPVHTTLSKGCSGPKVQGKVRMKCRRETIGKDSKEGRADIWQDKRKSGQEGRKEVGT